MADQYDIDAALTGWYHYHLNLAGYEQLASDLNTERGYPKLHTLRAIALPEDSPRGTDGSYMLRVTVEFNQRGKSDGAGTNAFDDNTCSGGMEVPEVGIPSGAPLLTSEYEKLIFTPKDPT